MLMRQRAAFCFATRYAPIPAAMPYAPFAPPDTLISARQGALILATLA